MNNIDQKYKEIIQEFEKLTQKYVIFRLLENGNDGHNPNKLNENESGVYIFLHRDICLKVGKAGAKSQARWSYHHYGTERAKSTLAKSICRKKSEFKKYFTEEFYNEIDRLNDSNIEEWMKKNLTRVELILTCSNKFELNLLEALAQIKLNPIFEGKSL
jgi:hypothetical protein